jgi:bacterioferritin-associated ferredoxin
MDCQTSDPCNGCPAKVVCRCLQVTEDALVTAISALELRSVHEVRRHIGAGDGCTCCHAEICQILEQVRPEPRAACA